MRRSKQSLKRTKQAEPERVTFAVIRSGKKKDEIPTYHYWVIVGALQWMVADRLTAYDTAKLIIKSKAGDQFTAEPGITISIIEKEI